MFIKSISENTVTISKDKDIFFLDFVIVHTSNILELVWGFDQSRQKELLIRLNVLKAKVFHNVVYEDFLSFKVLLINWSYVLLHLLIDHHKTKSIWQLIDIIELFRNSLQVVRLTIYNDWYLQRDLLKFYSLFINTPSIKGIPFAHVF